MSTLTPTEKEFFEELFGMETGYVLENVEANITNARFRSIVRDTTGEVLGKDPQCHRKTLRIFVRKFMTGSVEC